MFASVACGPVRFGRVTKIVAVATSLALLLSPFPWFLIPLAAALIGGTWIWTRPEG